MPVTLEMLNNTTKANYTALSVIVNNNISLVQLLKHAAARLI